MPGRAAPLVVIRRWAGNLSPVMTLVSGPPLSKTNPREGPKPRMSYLEVKGAVLTPGCLARGAAELKRVADALSAAGIENTGAKRDETLGKDYVAFKDPDRIAWEFYMA